MSTSISVNTLYYHVPGGPMIPTTKGRRSSFSVTFDKYAMVETDEAIRQGPLSRSRYTDSGPQVPGRLRMLTVAERGLQWEAFESYSHEQHISHAQKDII